MRVENKPDLVRWFKDKVEVVITLSCNEDCKFCFINLKSGIPLERGEIEDIIAKSAHNGKKMIDFTGGEPTLSPHLTHFIETARGHGIREINVQSNGLLLSDKALVKKLKEAGLTSVLIAFPSHKAEVCEALTGVKSNLSRVVAAVENVLSEKIYLRMMCVINKLNYEYLEEYVEFIDRRFSPVSKEYCVIFSFIFPGHNAWNNNDIIPMVTKTMPYLKQSFRYAQMHSVRVEFAGDIAGIPLCCLKGMEEYSIFYREEEPLYNEYKILLPQCKRCKWFARCNGVLKRYVQLYGGREFSPVL